MGEPPCVAVDGEEERASLRLWREMEERERESAARRERESAARLRREREVCLGEGHSAEGEGERRSTVEGGEVKQETLTSYIYIEDGYRASTGPIGPRPFSETGLIVCPPPKIDLWRRAP